MGGDGADKAAADARHMAHALALGDRGLGATGPNPSVGCVIVDAEGVVIGRGATALSGRPHAEAVALEDARVRAPDRIRGATAYVTLEPCAHHGRTPPCADALAAAGVARVVSAVEDPDMRVSGAGHGKLRAAGVDVAVGLGAEAARRAHAGHFLATTARRPYLTLKLATTVDGRIAAPSGESQWITSEPARRRAHLLRARHDAVMVGAGTARADDPLLTVRLRGLEHRRPLRIILDSGARTPSDGRLAATVEDAPVLVVHADGAPAERLAALSAAGVSLAHAPKHADGGLDLHETFALLVDRGVRRVFCEGGGGLAASLLAEDLVDRLILATAGIAIGGDGVPCVGAMGLERLSDAPRLRLASAARYGGEIWSEWERP